MLKTYRKLRKEAFKTWMGSMWLDSVPQETKERYRQEYHYWDDAIIYFLDESLKFLRDPLDMTT